MKLDYARAATEFQELLKVMAQLRNPENGCPWDLEQTSETILVNLIEETYEVVETIISKDYEGLKEELGDLLMQIVFHSQIATEQGLFTITEVIQGIKQKLIRRHPHVFGNAQVSGSKEVLVNWENIKDDEKKKKRTSRLDGVPMSMPALARAFRIQEKVARFGFDWNKAEDVLEKIEEELNEVKEAAAKKNRQLVEEEIGDLLFTIVNYARHLGVEPETALTKSINKFIERFKNMEELIKKDKGELKNMPIEELDKYWERVK